MSKPLTAAVAEGLARLGHAVEDLDGAHVGEAFRVPGEKRVASGCC